MRRCVWNDRHRLETGLGPSAFETEIDGFAAGVAARAREAEVLRRLPDETVAELEKTGLLRAMQPRRWGGLEVDPLTFFARAMEVARGCPSTAWCLAVVGIHPWQLALFPERAQQEVWGPDPQARISSSYAPTGSVEPVPGGFRLRGRWSFSSGCDHCTWVFLGGVAGPRPDGLPDMRTFLLPSSDYAIEDDWHVMGLAATGSKSIVVADAFVPEHRTHSFVDAYRFESPGMRTNDGPLFRLPFGCIFSFCIAVPAVGAAQGALDACARDLREKRSAYDKSSRAEDAFAQVRVAHAAAEIEAARAAVRETWEPMWELARAAHPIPIERRARARWTAANVVLRSVRAVDALMEASGGRGLFLDHPIQRFFRDVHAMRAHALNDPDKAARLLGQAQLRPDAPPADFFL
jgi:3-hydroxy-9,10-secoandrosta-1,3,5(10)-triene-9,17-dione monooxygenase